MRRMLLSLSVLPTLVSGAHASRVAPFSNTPDQVGSPVYGSRFPPGGLLFAEYFTAESALRPALSFSRSTTATFINASSLLATASTNVPRFDDAGGTAQGLLYEAQATNQVVSSNDFSRYWYSAGSPTLSAGPATPDGPSSTLWTRTVISPSFFGYGWAKAGTPQNYASRFVVHAGTGTYFAVRMQGDYPARVDGIYNLSNGTLSVTENTFTNVSGTMTPLGSGWYLVTLYGTTDFYTSLSVLFSFNSNGEEIDTTDSVKNSSGYVAEAQAELVSGQTVPTSYIPTSGASVTRAADSLSSPPGVAFGPSLVEYKSEATGTITRAAMASGSFAWPTNVWLRTVCVWPAGTPLSRVQAQTSNLGAPCQ